MAGIDKNDLDLRRRIGDLVDEEHALERGLATPLDEHRLERIAVELDQCWDLLRQRHARNAVGLNAAGAQARPASLVEAYLQ